MNDLAFPITFETEDVDGNWILINVTKYLGDDKWAGFDEDGENVVVDGTKIRNPRLWEPTDDYWNQ